MNFAKGMPGPQSFISRVVTPETIPKSIFYKLNADVRDLWNVGFDQYWYYTAKQSLTSGVAYGVACLHSSKLTVANAIYVSVKTRERLVIALLSDLADGTMLGTTNKKQEFNPLPGHIAQRKIGASAQELLELHQQKLSALHSKNPARVLAGLNEVAAVEDKLQHQVFDDKIRRGIWVEMTDAEVEALRAQRATAFAVPPS